MFGWSNEAKMTFRRTKQIVTNWSPIYQIRAKHSHIKKKTQLHQRYCRKNCTPPSWCMCGEELFPAKTVLKNSLWLYELTSQKSLDLTCSAGEHPSASLTQLTHLYLPTKAGSDWMAEINIRSSVGPISPPPPNPPPKLPLFFCAVFESIH